MVHIRDVQTETDSWRMCLPFRHGLGGHWEVVVLVGGTLSDAPLVVNSKWHSSSSAFPPPPQLVLFLFCPVLFVCVCVGVLIVMSWTGRRGPAHVHDAVPEMSPYENKSLMSSRTRARHLREATALEVKNPV